MREIFDNDMVFHTQTQIANYKNKMNKIYNNVLVIKDDNFNDFLNTVNGE
jgi:predicted glycosyltransferase